MMRRRKGGFGRLRLGVGWGSEVPAFKEPWILGCCALEAGSRVGWGAHFSPGPSDISLCPSLAGSQFLQQIMRDKWINIGYEGEELKPYTEPEEDFGDTKRIGEGHAERSHRPQSWGRGSFPALTALLSAWRSLRGP